MASWTGKVQSGNGENSNNISITHDLQDCIDDNLDFNYNTVYSDLAPAHENGKVKQEPSIYIHKIGGNNENSG